MFHFRYSDHPRMTVTPTTKVAVSIIRSDTLWVSPWNAATTRFKSNAACPMTLALWPISLKNVSSWVMLVLLSLHQAQARACPVEVCPLTCGSAFFAVDRGESSTYMIGLTPLLTDLFTFLYLCIELCVYSLIHVSIQLSVYSFKFYLGI